MSRDDEDTVRFVRGDRRQGVSRVYVTMGLMASSALILSASVIVYFNSAFDSELISTVCNSVELAAVMLMPYMISAAVAAITAIGIVTIQPFTHIGQSLQTIQFRLREMASGDLSSKLRLDTENSHIKQLSRELNFTIGDLGGRIAEWKVINRQQWESLESVRQAAVRKDYDSVLLFVDEMEKNWHKIAVIEEQLIT